MNINLRCSLTLFICLFVVACGGGESSTPAAPQQPQPQPQPQPVAPLVSISVVNELAVEKGNVLAKLNVERTGDGSALSVSYSIDDIGIDSATSDDYTLMYSDGGLVGNTIELAENQNNRVIELHPVQDEQREVIESISLSIEANESYQVTADNAITLRISDANNSAENNKVFIGYFSPQDDATTVGSGVLSLVLQGDNEQAILSYEFTGLSSTQTDQHIHLAPSGTMIKDIEATGAVYDYVWDLFPGGPFTSKQQMLDTLFDGLFYLNIHTANYPNGEIFATLQYDEDVAPPEDSLLTEADIERDIIRFLTQATFGATPTDYARLKAQMNSTGSNRLDVYSTWIDEQIALPTSSMLALTDATKTHFPEEDGWFARRDAFWPIAIYANDQLRQRMSFALSEILVIGDNNTTIRRAYRGTADYWDTLAEGAFGQYSVLLEDVARHAIMGVWLSHLKNAKANEDEGTFPDENFAREIMQLFGFGLVHLQPNGTVKLGENNLPQTTYDNDTIKALARVFTGLSFSKLSYEGTMVDNNRFKLGNNTSGDQYRWTEPMTFFVDEHDFGGKTLFNTLNEVVEVAPMQVSLENADNELSDVIQAITAHPTTAPFISYRLIQRFVTSNPSNDYVERVSQVFGETGDLKKTIKAILLDPEARNPAVISSSVFGKTKEPILRFSSIMRLLNAYSSLGFDATQLDYAERDTFAENASLLRLGSLPIGQNNLGAPSVFNFFSPDFSPSGPLASQSLVAPELELMTEGIMVNTINALGSFIIDGLVRRTSYKQSDYSKADLMVTLNKQILTDIWQQTPGSDEDKARAVLDYLDFYLNANQLTQSDNPQNYQAIIDAMLLAQVLNDKIDIAIYGIVNAPESIVQQ